MVKAPSFIACLILKRCKKHYCLSCVICPLTILHLLQIKVHVLVSTLSNNSCKNLQIHTKCLKWFNDLKFSIPWHQADNLSIIFVYLSQKYSSPIRPRCFDRTSRSFFYYMVKIHSFLNTSFRQCLEYFI